MNRHGSPWVKICGVTCVEDAELVAHAGADAIGLNFVPGTRRFLDRDAARRIADAVRGRVEIIGVFADEDAAALTAARAEIGLDWLQLHGEEPADLLERLPRAFKALGVRSGTEIDRAFSFPGERLLIDAKVEGERGGTGLSFDWSLLEGRDVRRVIVAGGLNPENVGALVARVAPFGVDVASGVERAGDARRKDAHKVHAFVDATRGRA